jgi:spore maturation protein CgeB
MYRGYLDDFYKNNSGACNLEFNELYSAIINDSTEFVASYTNNLNKLGIETNCVIANDLHLQTKWEESKGIKNATQKETIFNQVRAYKPDILWIDDFRQIDKNLISRFRSEISSIKLIIGYFCSSYDTKIIGKLKYVDFTITCTPGLREELEKEGLKCYHIYHGFDVDIFSRLGNKNEISKADFVFSGSLFQGKGLHNKRIELIQRILDADLGLSVYMNLESSFRIRAKQSIYFLNRFLTLLNLDFLKKHFPVLEYSRPSVKNYPDIITRNNHAPVYGIDMYKLLSSSDLVLNIHGDSAGKYCGNMRMFEATGVGTCLLTENRSNLKELFDPDFEIVAYNGINDCIEKAKWLLANEHTRKEIAEAGQNKTLKYHKVEDRCLQIIDILNKELSNK